MTITKRGFIALAACALAASLFAGHHHRHFPHGTPHAARRLLVHEVRRRRLQLDVVRLEEDLRRLRRTRLAREAPAPASASPPDREAGSAAPASARAPARAPASSSQGCAAPVSV